MNCRKRGKMGAAKRGPAPMQRGSAKKGSGPSTMGDKHGMEMHERPAPTASKGRVLKYNT